MCSSVSGFGLQKSKYFIFRYNMNNIKSLEFFICIIFEETCLTKNAFCTRTDSSNFLVEETKNEISRIGDHLDRQDQSIH